jgi:hypothetical protein
MRLKTHIMKKINLKHYDINIIIFLLVVIILISNAQDTIWTRRFNIDLDEEAWNVTKDIYDNVIVVGPLQDSVTSDILLLKYNQNGDLLWSRIFDTGQIDWGFCVATDLVGNIIVGSYHDDLIIEKPGLSKFSPAGDTIWSRMYPQLTNYWITGVCIDGQNNIYACGMSTVNSSALIAKFDTIGNILWYRFYCWGNTQTFSDIILDRNSNIFIVGDLDYGPWVLLLAKFNNNGDSIWTRCYSDNNLMCDGLQLLVDTSGNIVIAGYIGIADSDVLILKYSSSGNLIWNRRINYRTIDRLNRIGIDNFDNIFVSGFSGTWNNFDYLLIKLTPSGETLWTRFYNAGYDDASAGVVIDGQNNPIITGKSSNGVNYDILTIKYSGSSGIEESNNKIILKDIFIRLYTNIITNWQICLSVLKPTNYMITLYDIQGRRIKTIQDGFLKGDEYSFNLGFISNGIYFLEIKAKNYKHTQKIIITK